MIMRDSTRAGLIPPGTPVVAGYADGDFAWTGADWALFPDSVRLAIAVHPEHVGDILDVERGDAVPEDIPGWCDRFARPDRRAPTIYCSRSAWLDCQRAAGVRRVDWWISTLDGTTSVPGAVAVQYVDFGGYDESVILDPTWVGMSTGEDIMDMDTARAIVHVTLAMQDLLGDQAQVDSFAAQMVPPHNPEQGLTALEADIKADPRSLYARLQKLLGPV